MIIYIDENMPASLAKGFNILQEALNARLIEGEPIEILSIKEKFGRGAADEEWIPIAGEQNACVITQDYNIKRIRHQRELCQQYGLGMFYFRPPSNRGFDYWDMVKLMVKHWQEINNLALTQTRPFAYKITSKGKMEAL